MDIINLAISSQTALFLISISFLLTFLIPKSLRSLFIVVVIIKITVITISSLLASYSPSGVILPGNVDQFWYIGMAEVTAQEINKDGFFVDYADVLGVYYPKYLLYHYILGWLAFSKGDNLFTYRLFNMFTSLLIVIYGVKIAQTLYGKNNLLYQKYVIIGLGLLPSTNMYTLMVMRDVLITLLVTMFIYHLIKWQIIPLILTLGLTYLTRWHLVMIMGTVSAGWSLIGSRLLSSKKSGIKIWQTVLIAGILAITGYAMTYVVPSLAFMRNYVTNTSLLLNFGMAFPISFLGLDFAFTDASNLAISRTRLLLGRLIAPETIILPFLMFLLITRKSSVTITSLHKKLQIVFWLSILVYTFAYYTNFGFLTIRALSPFYPYMYLLVLPLIVTGVQKLPRFLGLHTKPTLQYGHTIK
ncbi:hypothetical protein QUF58_05680 [Anaerolineales bacterium HSG24]|nr:hypothetical protein [Anaerolineales bacterium HSG24]